ncbi:hypothetical protein Tco_1130046 [Tanacetum coccineum]
MAQSQRQADVHQDELFPPNKHFSLMDANKNIDLDNPLCPDESKILANTLLSWIYLGQFWHTLKEYGSKTIFQLPQATNNNHERFVAAPKLDGTILPKRSWFYTGIKIAIQLQDNWSRITVADTLQDVCDVLQHESLGRIRQELKIPSWMTTDEIKLTKNYRMLDSGSYKENPEVEIIADVSVNVIEEEENSS